MDTVVDMEIPVPGAKVVDTVVVTEIPALVDKEEDMEVFMMMDTELTRLLLVAKPEDMAVDMLMYPLQLADKEEDMEEDHHLVAKEEDTEEDHHQVVKVEGTEEDL